MPLVNRELVAMMRVAQIPSTDIGVGLITLAVLSSLLKSRVTLQLENVALRHLRIPGHVNNRSGAM